jgi:hypothetical protein
MPDDTDLFRDFGVLPYVVAAPSGPVRCFLSRGQAICQCIAFGLVFSLGLAMAVALALGMPFPINLLICPAPVLCFGYPIGVVTRSVYGWVELDGGVLRARHLYTRRVIERPVEEIADLLTCVLLGNQVVVAAWLGRICGIKIRFRDGRTPIDILRTVPAMRNAREFIEALIFRMRQVAPLDTEVTLLHGKPLIRRIFWKESVPTTAPTHTPTSQQYRPEGRLQHPGRENA